MAEIQGKEAAIVLDENVETEDNKASYRIALEEAKRMKSQANSITAAGKKALAWKFRKESQARVEKEWTRKQVKEYLEYLVKNGMGRTVKKVCLKHG